MKHLIADLVAANRILAHQGVVDAFGHVSVRHPDDPKRFLMSRARPPERVEPGDIMEYSLEGEPVDPRGRKSYRERFIHAALFEARPEVKSVIHNHSRSVIPFGISEEKLRPVVHSCATIGAEIPVWDAQTQFGDTDLLISDMAMGRDFAKVLGQRTCALMRGHGCTVVGRSIREAVYTAVYLEVNANLQIQASRFGKLKFLTPGEIAKITARLGQSKAGEGYDRSWEYWCGRAGISAPRMTS